MEEGASAPFLFMGLFTKKVLSQAVQTLALVEDTPELVKPSVLGAVLGNGNITANMVNNVLNSFSGNVKRYYTYGRDYFTNGLPEGTIGRASPDVIAVQAALETKFPPAPDTRIRQNTSILDKLYVSAFASETLRNTTNWDPDTYELIESAQTYVVDPNSAVYLSPTTFEIDYVYNGPRAKVVKKRTLTISSKYTMDPAKYYYMISFVVLDINSATLAPTQFWNYDPSTDEYPDLNVPSDAMYTQYMPVVPLRINNKNLTDPALKGTPLYDTSKKLLSKVELNIQELNDGVNNNPDISEVDHAYVVMGISIHTDKQESIKYLYMYFDDLEDRSFYNKTNFDNWSTGSIKGRPIKSLQTPPINEVHINDSTYNIRIVYYYIDKTSANEVIGKVGEYVKIVDGGKPRVTVGAKYSYEDPDNKLIIKKQVTPTQVDIITVSGALFVNNILGGKDFVTTITYTKEDNFIIPLNLSITEQMSILDRNTVYYDSLRIVFHAFQWNKLKWYETNFFKFVTIVVAVAITVVTGYDWGLSSLVAAASAGAIAFTSFIIQKAIIYVAVSYGFKLVAKEVGFEIAALLAVLAIGYGAMGSDSFFNLPMADVLAFSGTLGLQSVLEYGYEVLGQSYAAFLADVESKQEELDKAQQLLGNNVIDPMLVFTSVNMLPMESPSDFIDRSLMVNQGILSIDAVSAFYDTQLTLPTARS